MSFVAFYPPAGAGSTNASIGTNGAVAPTSSTEVGGIGPDGNLHPISTDNSGVQNVNVTSSTLPTGGATAARQDTGNTSLASIDSKTPALGQALAASSVPIVLTAAQLSTLTPLTSVTVTQATGTNLHAVIDSSALPTGASTSALQTTGNTSIASVVTNTNGITVAQGSTTSGQVGHLAQGAVTTAAPTYTTAQTSPLSLTTAGALRVDASGSTAPLPTGAATAANQATEITSLATIATNSSATQGTVAAGTAATKSDLIGGVFNTTLPTLTTGQQAAVQLDASGRQILGTSAAVIGSLVANQSVNVAQFGATAVSLGSKVSASSIPVVIASDQAVIATKSPTGRALANAPTVTTYSTPVTSSAYVTIIASTTSTTNLVEIFDSSGVALYFAVGAAASEVNQFVIYPGGNGQVPISIPAGSRISYKAVSTSATGATAFNVLNLYT
jgi:hypothetical protein